MRYQYYLHYIDSTPANVSLCRVAGAIFCLILAILAVSTVLGTYLVRVQANLAACDGIFFLVMFCFFEFKLMSYIFILFLIQLPTFRFFP